MDIKDKVFLVSYVKMYGNIIPNSGQILIARVIEILAKSVAVEVNMGNGKVTVMEVKEGDYYKTFGEAINALEPLINDKVKFVDEKDYKGEDLPILNV